MDDWSIANAAESLVGLFGHDAPENAALDIAEGYGGDEGDAEEVWERYNKLVAIEQRLGIER